MFTRKAMYFFGFLYVLLTVAFSSSSQFLHLELLFHVATWFWLAWLTYFVIHDRRGERPGIVASFFKSVELMFKGWWLLAFLIGAQLFVNYVYYILPKTTTNLIYYLATHTLIILVPFFVLPLLMDDITRCLPVLRYCWFEIKHGLYTLIVYFIGLLPLSFMLFAMVAGTLLALSTLFNLTCGLYFPQIYCISIPPYVGNFIVYQVSRSLSYIFVAVSQSIFYQSMIYGRD
jgi:hypothetical protein